MLCFRTWLVSIVFFLSFNAVSANSNVSLTVLQKKVEGIAAKHNLPGFQLVLSNKNEQIASFSSGVSSFTLNEPVTPDTVFRVGSISKTVTAMALMHLIQQENVSLDTPIDHIISDVKIDNPWRDCTKITLLHLLEHTAGLDDIHFVEYATNGSNLSTKQALAFHPHSRKVRYEPGNFMSYSNNGPTLIAYIIEKLSGLPFEQYVENALFAPLALKNVSFFDEQQIKQHLATGHVMANGNVVAVDYEHLKDRASGAMNSSAEDLAKVQRLLLNGATEQGILLLTRESLNRMAETESTLAAKAGFHFGYGKYLINQFSNNERWLGHSGEMNGYLSAMWHSTSRDIGYVFLTNTSGEKAHQANREIAQLVRSYIVEQYPVIHVAAETTLQHADSTRSLVNINELTGHYRQYTSRLALMGFFDMLESFSTVFIQDNNLMLKTPNNTYLLNQAGGSTYTTQLLTGETIHVVFIQFDGQWYYQIPSIFINARKTWSITPWLSYGLLFGVVVCGLLNALFLLIKFSFGLKKKAFVQLKAPKWIALAFVALIAVIISLGSAGSSGMPLVTLGNITVASVAVTLGLLLLCCFSLVAGVCYWVKDRGVLVNGKHQIIHGLLKVSLACYLVLLVTLAYLDFLFVALWQY